MAFDYVMRVSLVLGSDFVQSSSSESLPEE